MGSGWGTEGVPSFGSLIPNIDGSITSVDVVQTPGWETPDLTVDVQWSVSGSMAPVMLAGDGSWEVKVYAESLAAPQAEEEICSTTLPLDASDVADDELGTFKFAAHMPVSELVRQTLAEGVYKVTTTLFLVRDSGRTDILALAEGPTIRFGDS